MSENITDIICKCGNDTFKCKIKHLPYSLYLYFECVKCGEEIEESYIE